MRPRLRLLPAALLMAGLAFGAMAQGQGRGHMPAGVPAFGPPAWANNPFSQGAAAAASSRAAFGLERAELAQTQRLSRQQADRAAAVAKVAPQDYELDRNGALAIRGEVLASGLDAARLARIEKAGFSVVRRNEVPELGISLVVLTHGGMPAVRALDRLRRIDPDGTYDVNHVFFESGRKAAQPAALARAASAAGATPAASRRGTVVGLIDTGVAGAVDNAGRIHLQRRNFAPTQSVSSPHGTAVAALLARAPGVVTIYAADIFGVGPRGGTTELLVRALAWMAGERVPVINVSMVGPANALLAPIIRTMIDRGFTIVAPVGNDGAAARPLPGILSRRHSCLGGGCRGAIAARGEPGAARRFRRAGNRNGSGSGGAGDHRARHILCRADHQPGHRRSGPYARSGCGPAGDCPVVAQRSAPEIRRKMVRAWHDRGGRALGSNCLPPYFVLMAKFVGMKSPGSIVECFRCETLTMPGERF